MVLALVCAAPAVGGCQGPWAWGFLLAGAAALAILLVLFESFRAGAPGGLPGQLFRRPLIGLTLPALALLLWATLSWYLQDQAPAGEGRPALALRSLLFAWGFAAAFVAGLSAADNPWRLRRALALLAVVGCALAAVAVSQWFGSGPDEAFGWAISRDRPSGLYTNANRFAVLISVCWACALSLFLAILLGLRSTRSRRRRLKRRIWIAVLFGVVLLLSAGVAVTLSRWTLISTAVAVSLTTLVALLKRGRKSSETEFTYVSYHPEQRKEHLIKITALLFALAAPVAVVFALALTLAGRPLVNRFARIDQPDEMSRARSMRIAADLIAEKPALGWGLGGFENAFRPVQPMDMPGRWAQVHNDWLQVGVELGAPGLALAVLAALGLSWLAWRALPRTKGRIRAGFWLMLGGVTALAIPLLASIADFPLREPANGMVFF
ncbi:MAG: O-antigen ligase family protein, partial [Planctomycetota bacterium]|nr:O-antigen ligase family protein [Planctomycetota bacterium]